jgi:hypothetical protein
MDLMLLQVLLVCAFLAFLGLCIAAVLWVAARREADNRSEFIRKLPPPSQPLAVRAAHLRLLVREELIKDAKVEAAVAVLLIIGGLAIAVSDQASIGESVAVAGAIVTFIVVPWAILTGLYLLARYRGAQRRLRYDGVWHASSEGPPAGH